MVPIDQKITELVEPVLEDMGFELVNVEYLSKHGKWVLILYIDKEGGVSIDDCARVSGEMGDLIEVKDIIDHEYVLEVSSPGLDRPLKKEKDFIHSLEKKIKVRMLSPIGGRRNFTGVLKHFEGGNIYIELDGGPVILPWAGVEKANLVYEFSQKHK